MNPIFHGSRRVMTPILLTEWPTAAAAFIVRGKKRRPIIVFPVKLRPATADFGAPR